MKIGVTSQNFRTITGHAGKGRRFLVFVKDAAGQVQEVERLDLPKEMSMHEFRGETHPIDHVDVLITASCRTGFVRRMESRGIKVLTTSESDPLAAVTAHMNGKQLPPPEPHDHDHSH